ncbi:MAG TPA: serine/threonine-protein kinase [Polyangia bacterium]|nr:serine/threonine-protein kinase [Polyangia bacterium]
MTDPARNGNLGVSPPGFPRQFDSYVLMKPLARGGMGQLFLALTGVPGLEKLCVVKQVPPEVVATENARRFRDEAMVALRLSHGNLVTVFDAGLQGDRIFLAMDYVDGRDLHAVWNRCAEVRKPFPVDIAVYVIKELCRGLAYAHAFEDLRLVHRDVSPGNVLLSFSGEVKLTDFGLATSSLKMEKTSPGIIYGKLSYLSPEQARREPLDGRTDLYAAGILLWELLTGRQLFPVARDPGGGSADGANADAIQRARDPHAPAPSTLTARVPPELDRIVMKALAPEREDRYPDGEAMRADLAAFLAATSPKTDAATLLEFLRPMYAEEMAADRRERQALIEEAKGLLSGVVSEPRRAPTPAPAPAERPVLHDPAADAATFSGSSPRPSDSRPAGEDPRIGTTLGGRYYVRRLCGEGAMGRVYEAHHIDIGRRVAIKVLHASFHTSADLVERFRREARAASKIGHANIVDVTDSGTTPDGAFYFVMEYLDGTNLEELIDSNGPLPVERALLICAQIARALEAAHAAEVIHRDLKPANIMLVNRKGEDDFVKVLDFGISKDLDLTESDRRVALTRPDVAIGTPVYMAPEQAAGKPANALTDVYALGGLLYEMLTGCPPCAGTDAIDVLHKKAHEDPVPIATLRPDLPAEVQRLVTRALARAPRDRQPSMSAVKDGVLACLGVVERTGTGPTPIPGPSLAVAQMISSSTARVGQRRIARGGIAAALGAAGVVVLGAYWIFTRAPSSDEPEVLVAEPIAATAPAANATSQPPAPAAAPTRPTALDTESTPWPEREPAPTEGKRPLARLNTALPVTPASIRRQQFGQRLGAGTNAPPLDLRAGAPLGGSRATPGHTSVAAMAADADPARKAAAAQPERATGSDEPAAAASTAILNRGQTAFDHGDYPEAVRRGREAIAAGGALGGHLLVGDAYYRLERFPDALREYQAALALDPGNTSIKRRRDLAEKASPQ